MRDVEGPLVPVDGLDIIDVGEKGGNALLRCGCTSGTKRDGVDFEIASDS